MFEQFLGRKINSIINRLQLNHINIAQNTEYIQTIFASQYKTESISLCRKSNYPNMYLLQIKRELSSEKCK